MLHTHVYCDIHVTLHTDNLKRPFIVWLYWIDKNILVILFFFLLKMLYKHEFSDKPADCMLLCVLYSNTVAHFVECRAHCIIL